MGSGKVSGRGQGKTQGRGAGKSSDPIFSLFDILRKARVRRDALRSREAAEQQSPSAPIDHPPAERQSFIPFWIWLFSGSLVVCGAGIWLYSKMKNLSGRSAEQQPITQIAPQTPAARSFNAVSPMGAAPRPTPNLIHRVPEPPPPPPVEQQPDREPASRNTEYDGDYDGSSGGGGGEQPRIETREFESAPPPQEPPPEEGYR
ncbi:MAG: hypothetical protein HYX41_02815 [Bdellovibrio sp.]|nr:hypothetical protein [Bdellovibrio sp.]